jgi:O-antigen/teichoic acid export membrane protein
VTAASDPAHQNRKDSRAAGVYVASRTFAMLLLAVAYFVALRIYGKIGGGYVAAIYLVHETAMAIGSLGLPDAIFYFIGRDPARAPSVVREASAVLAAATVPVMGVVAVAALLLSGDGIDLVPAIPWLALAVLIELPTQPAVNLLIARGRAGIASALFILFAALRAGAVVVPLVFGTSLHTIPVVMALLGLLRLAAHVVIVRGLVPMPAGERWFDRVRVRELLLFALPMGLAAAVGKLNPQIDKYVAKLMLGTVAFTEYGAAAFEIPFVTLVPYAIGAIMQVRYVKLFAAGDVEELRKLWYATVEKTMIIVIPLAVVAIVLAEDLIRLTAGDQYVTAAAPFRIFTLVLLHRVAAYGPMLQASNQTRVLLLTSVAMLVTHLVLTVPMTYLVGYNGPAIAAVLSIVPPWIITLRRIGAALGGGLREALPWAFYGRVLLLSGVLGGALHAVWPRLGLPPGASVPLALLAYAALYLPLGYLIGVVRREDLHYLGRSVSFGLIK